VSSWVVVIEVVELSGWVKGVLGVFRMGLKEELRVFARHSTISLFDVCRAVNVELGWFVFFLTFEL